MGTHKKSNAEVRKKKYAAQFARTEANRKRKLAKHVKNHPNDLQAKKKVG